MIDDSTVDMILQYTFIRYSYWTATSWYSNADNAINMVRLNERIHIFCKNDLYVFSSLVLSGSSHLTFD